MIENKTFKVGELCLVPTINLSEIQHAYGIIIKKNPIKLRSNFYSVLYNGKIKEHENLFIAKIEEIENEYMHTN